MPETPNKPCLKCKKNLTTSTYCPACQSIQDTKKQSYRQDQDKRPSSRARGYDTAWERLRNWYLKQNPLCIDCQGAGVIRPAVVVHHIIPVEDDPSKRLDMDNLMSLCRDCHEIRHQRKRGKGFNSAGLPENPSHPWFKSFIISNLHKVYLTSVRIFYLTLGIIFYHWKREEPLQEGGL